METWQLILAWVLYLPFTAAVSYAYSTKFDHRYSILDKTDWVMFWTWEGWWIGLGVLITSFVI